jgi:ubiquinone/menaquinone biosynthesis C-methylase UbiE
MRLPDPTARLGQLVFGLGSRAYDLLTAQPLWREQIARLLELHPATSPEHVLDLGTGPGVSAFVLAEHLPAGSRVTGLDLSPQMIAIAERYAARRPTLPVEFLVADASRLPFGDMTFDRATGHSFLYLLPDPVAVLREVRRVLKPGGVATFMEPNADGSLWMAARSAPSARHHHLWDTLRFSTSMALWRVMSAAHTRMTPSGLRALCGEAELTFVDAIPTLGGLGLHMVARRD